MQPNSGRRSEIFKLATLFGPLIAFVIALQALKSHQLVWAMASISIGFVLFWLYLYEIGDCRLECEQKQRSIFGDRPIQGLKREVFIMYLAITQGDHKTAAFLIVTSLGATVAGLTVLLENL